MSRVLARKVCQDIFCLPNSAWADSFSYFPICPSRTGQTMKWLAIIKVNPTRVWDHPNHPVLYIYPSCFPSSRSSQNRLPPSRSCSLTNLSSYRPLLQQLSFLTSAFIIACSYIGVITYLFQFQVGQSVNIYRVAVRTVVV